MNLPVSLPPCRPESSNIGVPKLTYRSAQQPEQHLGRSQPTQIDGPRAEELGALHGPGEGSMEGRPGDGSSAGEEALKSRVKYLERTVMALQEQIYGGV